MKFRKETFGYVAYDEVFDKFWRLSEEDFKKFKIPKINSYSSDKPYGTMDLLIDDLSAPLSIGWMLTNLCNSKCLHCKASSGEKEKYELNVDEIKKILKMLNNHNVLRVVFSGGEPLIKEGIENILLHAINETDLSIILGTNGILLDKYFNLVQRVNFIETSLDSTYPEKHDWFRNYKGGYSKLVKNLRLLDKRIPLRIFTTLSKINLDEIERLSDMCYRLGASEHEFLRYVPAGRGKDNTYRFAISDNEYTEALKRIKSLAEKYKGKMAIESVDIKKNHNFNQSYVLIRPDGQLVTYSTYTDDYVYVGNIKKDDLSILWNKKIINKRAHLMLWTAESFF